MTRELATQSKEIYALHICCIDFENINVFIKSLCTTFFRTECLAKGGSPGGLCAGGFGVCCVCELNCYF